MSLSIAGLIGAALALVIGLVNYRLIMDALEPRLRALDRSGSAAEREVFEGKLRLMRRIILWTDVILFPPLGYAVGNMLAG